MGVNLSPTAIFSWAVVDFLCSALSSTAFASCVAPRTSPNWTSWLNLLLLPTVSSLRLSPAGAGLTWVTLKTVKNEIYSTITEYFLNFFEGQIVGIYDA